MRWRFLSLTLTLIISVLCGGCGIVVWPYASHVSSPVKKVRVEDAESGRPIASASLSYRTLFGFDIPTGYGAIDGWPVATDGPRGTWHNKEINAPFDTLHFEAVNRDGEFLLPDDTRMAVAQFWWPLPMMYGGWVQHYDFENVIVVRADGYGTKGYYFLPGAPVTRQPPGDLTTDGTLVLRLRKQSSAVKSQALDGLPEASLAPPQPLVVYTLS